MIRLSICIPTYNFGKFIGETLDSILPQLLSNVEIVVFDGGSTDDTTNEVQKRQAICKQLRYIRQDERGGIDRDIESAVKLARGEYCWLFSADDVMQPNAVPTLLDALTTGADVYLCEHILCDFHLQPIGAHPPFHRLDGSRSFDFSDPCQRMEYFTLARTSEAFFSFMAGPIFKLSRWNDVEPPDSFRGTCWIVAGRLLWGFDRKMKLQYLGRQLLLKRGENDSFLDRGVVNRYRIAIEGFQHVTERVFGRDTYEARSIRRVLQADVNLSGLLLAKLLAAENPEVEDIKVLNRLPASLYSDRSVGNWVRKAIYAAAPLSLLRTVRSFRSFLRRAGGQRV